MVNAKNAFMTMLVTGLVIAAVGTKKYNSGDWTTVSGDFELSAGDQGSFTGRYYAQNAAGCSVGQLSSASKGEQCSKNTDMVYQLEMVGPDMEFYKDNKQQTHTNLKTGETTTTESVRSKGDDAVIEHTTWTKEGDKIVSEDGLAVKVSNVVAPGKPIRALWGFLGKLLMTQLSIMWQSWQSCDGALAYFGLNIVWCIAGIVSAIIVLGLANLAALSIIPAIWSYISFMCGGFVLATIFIAIQCVILGFYRLIWSDSELCEAAANEGERALGGMGFGAPRGSSNNGAGTETCDSCRVLNRQLGGDCRALSRQLGGGCRALGGGGGDDCNGGKYKGNGGGNGSTVPCGGGC